VPVDGTDHGVERLRILDGAVKATAAALAKVRPQKDGDVERLPRRGGGVLHERLRPQAGRGQSDERDDRGPREAARQRVSAAVGQGLACSPCADADISYDVGQRRPLGGGDA